MTYLAESAPLTGGMIAGTIAAVVVLLVLIVCFVVALLWLRNSDHYDRGLALATTIGCGLACVATVLAWLWSSWPLSYDYHHWITKRVTVTDTSSRLLTDSNGNINQKFVVRAADGAYYGINDTRASLVREGARVVLRCKKAYEFGTPRDAQGWDCKWAGRMPS
jgi:uncharacterized membrane protein YccC